MKVRCNAKHGSDKNADKFWDDIALHYAKLMKKSNSINEECVSYSVIDIQRNAESLQNCWQRRLQPAIQEFVGIMSTNPPKSGEVKDDLLQDRYYSRMRQIYADQSHTFKRDVPRDFSKCMKGYLFLRTHPKSETEIPANPSGKRPSKNPNAIQAEGEGYESNEKTSDSCTSQNFVIHPTNKSRPVGRESSKRADAVKFIIDKVTKQTSDAQKHLPHNRDPIIDIIEKTLLESNEQMKIIARQQNSMANHQVVMSAPQEMRNNYFAEIYKTINLKTTNRKMEEEVHHMVLLA
jgi:hypothetical protein